MDNSNYTYLDLQRAIIERAKADYIKALFYDDKVTIKECEHFYKSSWGEYLTYDNGAGIVRRCKEAAEMLKQYAWLDYNESANGKMITVIKTNIPIEPREQIRKLIGKDLYQSQKGDYLEFRRFDKFAETFYILKNANII